MVSFTLASEGVPFKIYRIEKALTQEPLSYNPNGLDWPPVEGNIPGQMGLLASVMHLARRYPPADRLALHMLSNGAQVPTSEAAGKKLMSYAMRFASLKTVQALYKALKSNVAVLMSENEDDPTITPFFFEAIHGVRQSDTLGKITWLLEQKCDPGKMHELKDSFNKRPELYCAAYRRATVKKPPNIGKWTNEIANPAEKEPAR